MSGSPTSSDRHSQLALLADLPVLVVRLTATALEPIELPPYSSSSLRGAFGRSLFDLVCAMPPEKQECVTCPLVRDCIYPSFFQPRLPPGVDAGPGIHDAPRPYVVRSDTGGALPAGSAFSWETALAGRSRAWLPFLVLAWRQMGRRGIGRGRGRFRLDAVTRLATPEEPAETLYQEGRGSLGAVDQLATRPLERMGPVSALEVEFLSPTSLKYQGRPAAQPEFAILWRNLQRRLAALRAVYGEGLPGIDFRGAIEAAETVRLARWEGGGAGWERYSYKQDRRIPMQGFTGRALWQGDLAPFLPALQLGAMIGVGDNCAFGLGRYRLLDG